MTDPRDELVDIEHIKQLKARYFRIMDERNWDVWADVLTEDCEMVLEGDPPTVLAGRATIIDSARRNLGPRVGMHLGHMPEITIDDERTATGHWALLACSRPAASAAPHVAGPGMMSFGTYVDTYHRAADGQWRIAATRLTTVLRILGEHAGGQSTLGPAGGLVVDRL